MDFIASNQNIQNTYIEYSAIEQYAGDYLMKTEQDHIQIQVVVEGSDVSLTFQGAEGLEKEKLIFESHTETAEGKADKYKFASSPESTVLLMTSFDLDGKSRQYVLVDLPQRQLIAKFDRN